MAFGIGYDFKAYKVKACTNIGLNGVIRESKGEKGRGLNDGFKY